jgi:prepilin signal peptidase PulO-like enzyme (type II secretory pathway)
VVTVAALVGAAVWIPLAAVLGLPHPLPTASGACLVAALAIASLTDVRSLRIPDAVTLPSLAVALAVNLTAVVAPERCADRLGAVGVVDCLLGTVLVALPLFLLFATGHCGGGDVKLAAVIGAFLGPWAGLHAAMCGQALMGFACASYALLRWALLCKSRLPREVPFAPFLAAGTVASLWL